MINWDAALSAGKIISKAGYDTLWSPVRLNRDSSFAYGFGWFLDLSHAHPEIYHGGSWQGYNAFIGRFPADRLSVIVLANLSPCNPRAIAHAVAGQYIRGLEAAPPTREEDSEPQFTAVVERLYAHADTIKTSPLLFAPEYREEMKELLRTNWTLLATFGPVRSIEPVSHHSDNSSVTLTYRIRYKVGASLVTLRHNASGEITSAGSELE
jgi:D-alanyl-D-alanine carboxypeptidase